MYTGGSLNWTLFKRTAFQGGNVMHVTGANIVLATADAKSYLKYTLCGSEAKMIDTVQIKFSLNRQLLEHRHPLNFSPMCSVYPSKHRFRVIAGGMSKGNDKGMTAVSERSDSANEDILLFFFQLDLTTRIQCALNSGQYEIAQQLRNKLGEVEQEVARRRESKMGSASSKDETQDKSITILRLWSDLQKAVEEENYGYAAELRDKISKIEADSLAASAKALAYQNVQYAFRLGQKVRHKTFGYRAVICGMDPLCCESSSWMEIANVNQLSRGCNQPYYQVLVDVHADPTLLVAYVAEENLLDLGEPDLGRFDHPYVSFLFYGMDAAGDFIPIKQLREKYNRPRHEVPEEDSNNDNADTK